jgi:hypothetical protein
VHTPRKIRKREKEKNKMQSQYRNPYQLGQNTYEDVGIRDGTLDDANLEVRCPLDHQRGYSTEPLQAASRLESLPLEILNSILLMLDVPSLITLRRVSRRGMSLVNSVLEYQRIREHCPNILRAILSVNARFYSLGTLYEVLSTQKCETCDGFGTLLYLITCKRLCYYCMNSDILNLPVLGRWVTDITKITNDELQSVPHIISFSGHYTPTMVRWTSSGAIFDRRAVVSKAGCAVSALGLQDRRMFEPARCMSVISAPFIDPTERSVDWGLYCALCREDKEWYGRWKCKYGRSEIYEHLKEHETTTPDESESEPVA